MTFQEGEEKKMQRVGSPMTSCRAWVVTLGILAVVWMHASGCGEDAGTVSTDHRVRIDPDMTLLEAVDAGASLLWIGAHPDDDIIPGAILARACRGLGNPCLLLVVTSGEGGTCYWPPCDPDLGTVRLAEMEEAARRYGAELEIHGFTNHPGTTPMEEIRAKWESEGDITGVIAQAVRRFRPNLVLSLDASNGFYGHHEHRMVAELTREALALAGDPQYAGTGGSPVRADRFYSILNRYWFLKPFIGWDDGPVDEMFPGNVPCPGSDMTCFEAGIEAAQAFKSQWPYVLLMSLLGEVVDDLLLKRIQF